jgi:hypothetical protein
MRSFIWSDKLERCTLTPKLPTPHPVFYTELTFVMIDMMTTICSAATQPAIRALSYEPHRFAVPPGRSDRYTLVEIDLFLESLN